MASIDERIGKARRMAAFLSDELIVGSLELLERRHIGELCTAKTAPEMFRAQAQLNAVKELGALMTAVVDDGDHAAGERNARERAKREI